MTTFVETLKNNPIFQLSLSSKELFHSNFLAWLAEDDNTRCVFNKVMQTWLGNKNWEFKPNEMEVKREYNHFDFCVCDKLSIDGNDVNRKCAGRSRKQIQEHSIYGSACGL